MPLLVLLPLVAGGVGFGLGNWTGAGASKAIKYGLMGGGAFAAYHLIRKGVK